MINIVLVTEAVGSPWRYHRIWIEGNTRFDALAPVYLDQMPTIFCVALRIFFTSIVVCGSINWSYVGRVVR